MNVITKQKIENNQMTQALKGEEPIKKYTVTQNHGKETISKNQSVHQDEAERPYLSKFGERRN